MRAQPNLRFVLRFADAVVPTTPIRTSTCTSLHAFLFNQSITNDTFSTAQSFGAMKSTLLEICVPREVSLTIWLCLHTLCTSCIFYLSTIQYNLTRLCLGSFRQEKMLPPLMMKMAVAAAPPPSGYIRYHDGRTAQGPNKTAKVRGDDMVRLANASALLAPLAQFACPSWPPLEISFALLCATGIGMQVRRWAEICAVLTGLTGSCVVVCLRWPAGIWVSFFSSNSCRRL